MREGVLLLGMTECPCAMPQAVALLAIGGSVVGALSRGGERLTEGGLGAVLVVLLTDFEQSGVFD